MDKQNFIIRDQLFLMIKNLDENSAGQLVKAIAAHQSGEEYRIGNPFVQAAFNTFLPQVQADSERYEKTVQERSKASRKRWDKESSAPSSDANGMQTDANAMQMGANASVCIPNGIQMDSNRNVNINNNSTSTTTVSNKSNLLTTTTTSSAVQMVVEEYNKTSFPKVNKISEQRRKAIKARLNTFSLDEIIKAIHLADESPFMHGNGDKNWQADFDWIMGVKSGGDQHLTRILEGAYSRNKTGEKARSGTSTNRFHNFEQRNTDYDAIVAERMRNGTKKIDSG